MSEIKDRGNLPEARRRRVPRNGWGSGVSLRTLGEFCLSVQGALEVVDDALERQNPGALLEALHDPVLALQGVRGALADWYLEQLTSDREQKSQVRSGQHLSPRRVGNVHVITDSMFKWLSHSAKPCGPGGLSGSAQSPSD